MLFFLSRALVSAEIKTCRRCSIKLSAAETLYPQLLWQLWKTAISALCIIVRALRWGVSERGDNRAEQLCPRRHICYCEPSALLYAKGPFSNLLPWNHSTCLLVTTGPGSTFHSIYSQERQQLERKKGGSGSGGVRIKEAFIWRFIFVNILHLCSPIDGLAKMFVCALSFHMCVILISFRMTTMLHEFPLWYDGLSC